MQLLLFPASLRAGYRYHFDWPDALKGMFELHAETVRARARPPPASSDRDSACAAARLDRVRHVDTSTPPPPPPRPQLNIWTHLAGVAYFAAAFPRVARALSAAGDAATAADTAHYYAFVTGGVAQMLASTTYHVFRCMSAEWEAFLVRACGMRAECVRKSRRWSKCAAKGWATPRVGPTGSHARTLT